VGSKFLTRKSEALGTRGVVARPHRAFETHPRGVVYRGRAATHVDAPESGYRCLVVVLST
jgi:hypothetical protein